MKNMRFLIVISFVWSVLLLSAAEDQDPFDTFTVQQAHGDACEIKSAGASAWKPAKEGETHKAGSAGRTGSQSTLTVAFDAKNRFRLLPKTEIVIRVSTRDAKFRKVVDLTMNKGGVEVDLGALPENYQLKVQTPTAVCGAVGTEFTVNTTDDQSNFFVCENGTIFAQSTEDGSFSAPTIGAGQSVRADLAPGKENSYGRIETKGGKMPVVLGADDHRFDVQDGTVFLVAQAFTEKTDQVALKVEKGGVSDKDKDYKAGYYAIDGKEVTNFSSDKQGKGPALVEDYLVAAKKEGNTRTKLKQAESPDEKERLTRELDDAAKKATEKRRALFEYRKVIRDAVRGNMRLR
ncbi:MAG: FecR domain-containing protein [Verrucomicrobia bacterium]|nr:FecR domain-containing protein [Verrucomicrobiota bacterium]